MIRRALTRRAVLALPFAAACSSRKAGFRGYAFIANEEGHAVAAVDLGALAVAKLIPLDAAPVDVVALRTTHSAFEDAQYVIDDFRDPRLERWLSSRM